MKTYMVITNPKNEDYIVIKKYIEKNEKIYSWFAMWKFVIFNSEMNIKEVQDDFTESFDGMLFFIAEIKSKNICGSMPSDLWDFIIKTSRDIDDFENIVGKDCKNKINQKEYIISELSLELEKKREICNSLKERIKYLEELSKFYQKNNHNNSA